MDYQREQYKIIEDNFSILSDAKELSYKVELDVLDVNKSWSRQSTEKSYDEILEIIENSKRQHWTFMMRSNHRREEKFHFEVSVSNLETPSYFIWLKLSVEDGYKLIKKYKLKNIFSE